MENRLRETTDYQSLLNLLPFPLIITDRNWEIRWANKSALDINPEALGSKCYEVFSNRRKPCKDCPCIDAIHSGNVERKVIFHRHHIRGHAFYYEDIALPLRNGEGQVTTFVHIGIDITEAVGALKELKRSERFSEKLLACSPNIIVVYNPDASIKYVNPSFEKLTGFRRHSVVGLKPPFPWWPSHLEKYNSANLSITMGKAIVGLEEICQSRDGRQFWMKMNSIPIKEGKKLIYVVSNWTDITQLKELQHASRTYAQQILRVQEEERGRIARELHDGVLQDLAYLRNCLGEMRARTKFHHKDSKGSDDTVSVLLRRTQSMTEDVRRISQGLRPTLLDMLGLIQSIDTFIDECRAVSDDIRFKLRIIGKERRLPPETELALFRIAQEALNNVRKHSFAKNAEVIIKFSRDSIYMSIEDDGLGFTFTNNICNYVGDGRLGLISMNERVHLLNGSLRIKSKGGAGTKIMVTVPLSS